MKKILFVFLICCLGFFDGFSQKMPLSYYSPSSQDTALKKYTIALLNASLLFDIEEEEALYGIGAEVIYFDDFNKNFYASLKTQIGNQSFLKIELGKKIYKALYVYGMWEYNSISLQEYDNTESSFSMPSVFGGGIKLHSFKQKNDGKSRALEFNLGLKSGSGTFTGTDTYWSSKYNAEKTNYLLEAESGYISLATDFRIIQMKKISKIGVAYSLIGLGFYIGEYSTNSDQVGNRAFYEADCISFQFGVGISF